MKTAIYDRRVHLLFPPHLAEKAMVHAEANEKTMSELSREAVRSYLAETEKVAA